MNQPALSNPGQPISPRHPHYRQRDGHRHVMAWYGRRLAALPLALDSLTVPTRYGDTHVLAAGPPNAPPVVLLHGINVNALVWKHQLPCLAQFYRVYAPDVIGFAGRSSPVRLPYRGRHYAGWLLDVFDCLKIEQAHLIASSAGGYWSLSMAGIHPERVGRQVLINPSGMARLRFPYNIACNPLMTWLIGWFASHFLTNPRVSRWLARYGAAPGHPPDEEDIEFSYLLLKYFKRFPPPGRVEPAILARITATTLIMMGEFERYYPLKQVILNARRHLPSLYGVEIVANAGHDANKDQPDEVNRRLLAFLNCADPIP